MGAAAVAVRFALPRPAARARSAVCGLGFDELGGPVVAVCGLTGGAGTTTLALALARQTAAESVAPVLVSELAPHRGGLAVLAGKATPHALLALARSIDDRQQPHDTFVELSAGLRLIGATPKHVETPSPDSIGRLLTQARDAHGLVVVDCGTDWTADPSVLTNATHIVWALPATPAALARAQVLFESDVVPAAGRWREVLVAIAPPVGSAVRVRTLRRLARVRCERLALMPHDPEVATGSSDAVLRALTAIASILRSSRRVG